MLIDGEKQKNGDATVYPVVDAFADFLKAVPEERRIGYVFDTVGVSGRVSRRVDTVSGWILEIGAAAGVKDEDDVRFHCCGSIFKSVVKLGVVFLLQFGLDKGAS